MKTLLRIAIVPTLIVLTACGAPESSKTSTTSGSLGQDIFEPTVPSEPPVPPSETTDPETTEPETAPEEELLEAFPEDAQKFNRPWNRKDTAIVIDAYELNPINWDQMATDKRMAAVIHRSSIGFTVDRKYKERHAIAKQRGYLWGAYHLGRPGDPIGQAKLFLETVGDTKDVLLVLDLENTSSSSFMNATEAKQFMEYVYQKTGKVPVVYANHSVTVALNSIFRNDPIFESSRLWYARFLSSIPAFPYGVWPTYFLWQFSSEINCSTTGTCLYNVPGTKFDMDVNVFYGSKEALAQQWVL